MTPPQYRDICAEVSEVILSRYSTSFSWGTRLFPAEIRSGISAIYGFVRLADEIVDSFQGFDQQKLFHALQLDVSAAIDAGISTNPVLESFQATVNKYKIDRTLIVSFLESMAMDLTLARHSTKSYQEYVYGSAEAVGLMCLKIFCHNQSGLYEELVTPARQLGSAFQKVNFLRDIKNDLETRGRIYLPNCSSPDDLNFAVKETIESEIKKEFAAALVGISRLPPATKFAIYSTYLYYKALFDKLRCLSIEVLLLRRVRVSNIQKTFLLGLAFIEMYILRRI